MELSSVSEATAKAVEPISSELGIVLPNYFVDTSTELMALISAYYDFLNEVGLPSQVVNNIEKNHDVDLASDKFLDAIGLTIAKSIPQSRSMDKRRLYKIIAKYYTTRGSDDSVMAFFRIFYNEFVTLVFPKEFLFDSSAHRSLSSDKFVLRDSYFWQEFSYIINSEKAQAEWLNEYLRFVHPAGLKLFVRLTVLGLALNDWYCQADHLFLVPWVQDAVLNGSPQIDPCDYWQYIDWQKRFDDFDSFCAQHLPKFQAQVDRDPYFLLKVLMPDGGKHYLTHIRNVFGCPLYPTQGKSYDSPFIYGDTYLENRPGWPGPVVDESLLRAFYRILGICYVFWNKVNQLELFHNQYLVRQKFIDYSAHTDGYGGYEIIDTYERDNVEDLVWTWETDGDVLGWSTNQMTVPVAENGLLQATITNDTNPYFISPDLTSYGINLAYKDINEIEIKFRAPEILYDAPDADNTEYPVKIAVFFQTTEYPTTWSASNGQRQTVNVSTEAEVSHYSFSAPAPPGQRWYRAVINMNHPWYAGQGVVFNDGLPISGPFNAGRESVAWGPADFIEDAAEVPTGLKVKWYRHRVRLHRTISSPGQSAPRNEEEMDLFFDPSRNDIGVDGEDGVGTHIGRLNFRSDVDVDQSPPDGFDNHFEDLSYLRGAPWYASYHAYSDTDANGNPTITPHGLKDLSIEWTGYLRAPETGTYTFGIDSDDCSDLFVNGTNVANFYSVDATQYSPWPNDGHGMSDNPTYNNDGSNINTFQTQTTGTITLKEGEYYPIRVRLEQAYGTMGLRVAWLKPSVANDSPESAAWEIIPAEYFHLRLPETDDTNLLTRLRFDIPQALTLATGTHEGSTTGDRSVAIDWIKVKRALHNGYRPRRYDPNHKQQFKALSIYTAQDAYSYGGVENLSEQLCVPDWYTYSSPLGWNLNVVGVKGGLDVVEQFYLGSIYSGLTAGVTDFIKVYAQVKFSILNPLPGDVYEITPGGQELTEANGYIHTETYTIVNNNFSLSHPSYQDFNFEPTLNFNFYENNGTSILKESTTFNYNILGRIYTTVGPASGSPYEKYLPELTIAYNRAEDDIVIITDRHEYTTLDAYLNSLAIHDEQVDGGIQLYDFVYCSPTPW